MQSELTTIDDSNRDVPLQERQRASSDEVLKAAAEAFITRGYAATSIDDIADRLGCTKGRVYHYFRTKGELFLGVHRRALDMAMQAVEPLSKLDAPAAERLSAMAVAHARLMMEETSFMRLAVQHAEMNLALEGRTPKQSVVDIFSLRDAYEGLFEGVIGAGVKDGEFRQVDPGLMAKACLGSLNWMSVWYRPASGDSVGPAAADIAREFAEFVTCGLLDRPARKRGAASAKK